MTTAIVHHPIAYEHDTGAEHPEQPARYRVVIDALRHDVNLQSRVTEIEAAPAARGHILACHTAQHFKKVERAVSEGIEHLDGDTVVSMRSLDAALHAAGAACQAVDQVMKGEASNAFVPVRPPGHHATSEHAMGFCLFNNAGIAARYAQNIYKEIKRVAIIDWDVHHGNGTQGIFYDDPSVFFFSMHQYPWYPGTGATGETGTGRGRGYTLNLPVRAHTQAAEQRRMFDAAIEEISRRFTPDLIIVSAGFDAHRDDPLGQLQLVETDFAQMTRTIKEWAREACAGRVVSCLEGGYNLDTLASSSVAHVKTLAED